MRNSAVGRSGAAAHPRAERERVGVHRSQSLTAPPDSGRESNWAPCVP